MTTRDRLVRIKRRDISDVVPFLNVSAGEIAVMRRSAVLTALTLLAGSALPASAVEIRGQYLESRTCDVYTGPCFANGEIGLAGREAVMAWKVEEGVWKGISLDGLSAVLVVRADDTLGDDGVFPMNARQMDSVILVDEQASEEQQLALVDFVRDAAARYTQNVKRIERTAIQLDNDHATMEAVLTAGDVAEIRTRRLNDVDCVCSNEKIFFQPLTDVHYAAPAYSLTQSYQGEGLESRWTSHNSRSAFLAIFKK